MTHQQLFANIIQDPLDRTLRGVLADALEELDQPLSTRHATLIRLQVQRAELPPPPDPNTGPRGALGRVLHKEWSDDVTLKLRGLDHALKDLWRNELLDPTLVNESANHNLPTTLMWDEGSLGAVFPQGIHWVTQGFVGVLASTLATLRSKLQFLVPKTPIHHVLVTDRIPRRWTPDAGSASEDPPDMYSWTSELTRYNTPERQSPHLIPDDLIRLMNLRTKARYNPTRTSVRYHSPWDAQNALSDALVTQARRDNGLPDLPPPERTE